MKAYTLDEVADILKVTKRTLYTHIKTGKLPATKLGKYYRVTEEQLQRLLTGKTPARATGQLQLNERNRYEVAGVELKGGDALEVLIMDYAENKPKWITTALQSDGESYYLEGLKEYAATGLFARV